MILLNLCFLAVKAQEMPEVYLLWPDGPEENNGLADQEITESNGNITFNSTAKLHVYHPEKEIQNGIAVIICPGGGYSFLSMEYEGRMFAQWLIKQGITAIILQYRMPAQHDRIPLADAQRAMRWVRNRAENWGINPDKVGIAGFSAGGHLASTLATHFDQRQNQSHRQPGTFQLPSRLYHTVLSGNSMQESLTHKGSQKALLGKTPAPEKITDYSNELQITAETPKTFLYTVTTTKVYPYKTVLFTIKL